MREATLRACQNFVGRIRSSPSGGDMAASAPEQAESEAAPQPLDRITLTGITGYGHHGVFPAERDRGQTFVVDLTCSLDLARAAAEDDLGQTVDYAGLAQAVVADGGRGPL